MDKICLYVKTIKHLKLRQIVYQLRSRLVTPRLKLSKISTLCVRAEHSKSETFRFSPRWTGGEFDIRHKTFEFIGQKLTFGTSVRWGEEKFGGLWLDHLHYFRYLELVPKNRDNVRFVIELLKQWKGCREDVAKAFWPPYNASERAFCISRWYLENQNFLSYAESEFVLNIISQDIDFVSRNLELNLDGNHLLKNIAAVYWGTALFEVSAEHKWVKCVERYYDSIVNEQILPDGLHYEKSFIYHQLALIDFLDILAIHPDVESVNYRKLYNLTRKMAIAHQVLLHPQGRPCLFNDSSLNLSSSPSKVKEHYQLVFGQLKDITALEASGYYKLADDNMCVIVDAGNIGPDCQMGHAHSDMLHFELSWLGIPVLIEAGTSSYYSERRSYERSTKGHNTAIINDKSQSKNWGSFRVAERGRCNIIGKEVEEGYVRLSAQHNGYLKDSGIIHRRDFTYSNESLVIEDSFIGRRVDCVDIKINFHFSKYCSVDIVSDTYALVNLDGDHTLSFYVSDGSMHIEDMQYSENYNELIDGVLLVLSNIKGFVKTKISIV